MSRSGFVDEAATKLCGFRRRTSRRDLQFQPKAVDEERMK